MAKEENALTLQVSSETREYLQKVADMTGVKNLKTACEILIKVSWRPYVDKYAAVFGISEEAGKTGEIPHTPPETLYPVSEDAEEVLGGKEGPPEGYRDLIDFSL